MTDEKLSDEEHEQVRRLRASIEGWALSDIKRAASPEVDLPRLAFVGLAALIDVLTFLRFGRNKKAADAWESFFAEYLPERAAHSEELRDGLRNALLHEYGTRNVALTDEDPGAHWLVQGGLRIIHLESLVSEVELALQRFITKVESDAELRTKVLDRSAGLLAPVTLAGTAASFSLNPTTLTSPTVLSASATGPPDLIFRREDP